MESATNIQSGPAASMISAAASIVTVTDERGRKIGIRKPSLLDRMRLIEGLGALAENGAYLNHAVMLAAVTSIDGSVEPVACSKAQIEGMAARLDNEGLDAVVDGYSANFKKAETGDPDKIKK